MSPASRPALLALCLLCSPAEEAWADAVSFAAQSAEEKVAVLELFTSEGCSSCPPADEFVSTLARSDYYGRNVIPLAFHVTYWDYIGWRDPYAKPAFDDRQYAMAERANDERVYTPQLLLDGRSVRRTGGFLDRLEALNALPPGAHIAVRGSLVDGDRINLDVDVKVVDPVRRAGPALYVALFENGLASAVKAGENRGRTLKHDQVVRALIGPLGLAQRARQPSQREPGNSARCRPLERGTGRVRAKPRQRSRSAGAGHSPDRGLTVACRSPVAAVTCGCGPTSAAPIVRCPLGSFQRRTSR